MAAHARIVRLVTAKRAADPDAILNSAAALQNEDTLPRLNWLTGKD